MRAISPRVAAFLPRVTRWIRRVPFVRRLTSCIVIEGYTRATNPRPRPFSLAADYTTWESLTDRSFSGRHLPVPRPDLSPLLPPAERVLDLFKRQGEGAPSQDTSVMFIFFAQWFTDSFLRTSWTNNKKNESPHEIDLCQIYGLSVERTLALRAREGGLMKSQKLYDKNGREAEFPPFLYERQNGVLVVKEEFRVLHDPDRLAVVFANLTDVQRAAVFAVGLEHGNSVIGHSMLNVLFIREHNRIARLLAKENPLWDDERVFQTTRNVLIVILLKLVVEEYIVHIAPFNFPLEMVPFIAEGKKWNKSNWIAVEFNLLYRWHCLVPNTFTDGRRTLGPDDFRNNNPLILCEGIESLLEFASNSRASRMGLFNTPWFLVDPPPVGPSVEQRSIELMRTARLASYNAYRKAFGLAEKKSFEDLTKDKKVVDALRERYGTIDKLEWYVGIFAEDFEEYSTMGELMSTMVAYDAFTQALTNPLLARNVFNENTFTSNGLKIINETSTLQDLVSRNSNALAPRISFRCG